MYDGVIEVCVDMQSRVDAMRVRFREELGRHYYVTPTSYLELIRTFKSLCAKKQHEVRHVLFFIYKYYMTEFLQHLIPNKCYLILAGGRAQISLRERP